MLHYNMIYSTTLYHTIDIVRYTILHYTILHCVGVSLLWRYWGIAKGSVQNVTFTVSSHNFNSQKFKSRVSNPMSKYIESRAKPW